ncbi:MAG: phage tail protein [Methylococcales bacterium]
MFGGNFAPRGWALCNGQIMSIAQNTALFSLLGTTYGGDGQTTFALPDLRGRVPINPGQGPGLSNYILGEASGTESVTLTVSEMPAHNHLLAANSALGSLPSPIGNFPAGVDDGSGGAFNGYSATANGTMAPTAASVVGGNQPHPNMQPFLCVNFIIALEGIFPSRN